MQLRTRYWWIDGVSEHRYETNGTRNGRILTSKHLHLCPSWCNGHRARSRHNIRSTLQTFAKSSSYHCLLLTLSGDDRQKSPMMILQPSTRKEWRPWRWVGSWCLRVFCEKWCENWWRALRVVYLRLKYVNRVFCNEIFGRAGDFAKTSRKSIWKFGL